MAMAFWRTTPRGRGGGLAQITPLTRHGVLGSKPLFFASTPSSSSSPGRQASPRDANDTAPHHPRIAIVGAGPGGLTLGVLLQKRGIPFTLFELRPRPTGTEHEINRPQGVLDLHEGAGLAAIRACGLHGEFLGRTGECAEVSIWADKAGRVLYSEEADKDGPSFGGGEGGEGRPEISRGALNDLLIRNIEPGKIRWDHKLLRAAVVTAAGASSSSSLSHSSTSSVVRLTFDTNKAEEQQQQQQTPQQDFDLVVGADGAWSRIRSSLLVPGVRPEYRDRQCITLTIPHITSRHPALARLVGPGTWTALGDHHAVISQRGPMDSARLYLMLTTSKLGAGQGEDFPVRSGFAGMTPSEAKSKLLHGEDAIFASWGEPVRELIATACDAEQETLDNISSSSGAESDGKASSSLLDIRPLYQLPSSVDPWPHQPCATLIGDAAHLTLPSGGGVNIAMLDALEVSKVIGTAFDESSSSSPSSSVSSGTTTPLGFQEALAPLLARFEREMWTRADKARGEADMLQDLMFGSLESAETMAKLFRAGVRGD